MRSVLLLPFILGLSLLAASIESGISVPGFPQMRNHFSVTHGLVHLTMSLNFFGFCLGILLWGPLSDSFGRRPVMLFGNLIFLIASIGTAFSDHISVLIAWRFLQGIGAAATFTVAFVMIADAYRGEQASGLINRLNACVSAFMAAAPVAGGFLVQAFGWQSTYSSIALVCLVSTLLIIFFLPETNSDRKLLQPMQILKDFRLLVSDLDFMALTMGLTFQCAGYMAFVSCAVFAYVDLFQQSLLGFTLHQGSVIAAFTGVSFFGRKINQVIGVRTAMLLGIGLNVIGAALLLMLALLEYKEALIFTFSMCLFAIGVALCYGVTFTASMELFPNLKGSAASLSGSTRLLVTSLAIWGAGSCANGSFIPETTLIFTAALAGAALLHYAARRPRVSPLLV